jgi:hypothetical protein
MWIAKGPQKALTEALFVKERSRKGKALVTFGR